MGRFVKGNIIWIDFPHSDSKKTKRRTAYVVSDHEIESNIIVCAITGVKHTDDFLITLDSRNVIGRNLKKESYIRPNVINTLDVETCNAQKFAALSRDKIREVDEKLLTLFSIR